jgi:hypothetical protein
MAFPYYEKAMMMRRVDNAIYFASVNYALRFQESATALIAPSGQCQAYLPYGQEGVLVQPSRSKTRRVCWPLDTRRSAIEKPDRVD